MHRSKIIVSAFVFSILSLVAACSLQDGGDVIAYDDNPDGSKAVDASIDGASSDGSILDTSTFNDAESIDSSKPDASMPVDAGTMFLCGAIPVANCAVDCPAAPHDCPSTKSCITSCFPGCTNQQFQCDACGTDGGLALSRCEPGDAAAFSECLSGFNRCACSTGDVSACVGNNQTCENNQCFECGELDGGNQDSHACEKGGGATCHTATGTYGSCHN